MLELGFGEGEIGDSTPQIGKQKANVLDHDNLLELCCELLPISGIGCLHALHSINEGLAIGHLGTSLASGKEDQILVFFLCWF